MCFVLIFKGLRLVQTPLFLKNRFLILYVTVDYGLRLRTGLLVDPFGASVYSSLFCLNGFSEMVGLDSLLDFVEIFIFILVSFAVKYIFKLVL